MLQFLEKKELFDKILLLNEEEIKDPIKVIEQFFSDYRLHECRYNLWSMVETCITTENAEYSEPEERGNLLLRHKHFEKLLEANAVLVKKYGTVAQPSGEKE